MKTPITRTRLPNGLLVLLNEIHASPLISHWLWYRVGSGDEPTGKTGISHWIEHMQFKGTSLFPSGELDKAISRLGGSWNAFTFLDWTTYYEVLPADAIDLALRLEADRMVNSAFLAEDVASERTVIISERQGSENEPLFRLEEEVQATAFRVHPYHHQPIGDLPDLNALQQEDLCQHYRAYYTPGNAVLAVAGDFDTGSMLERIRQLYEPIPSKAAPRRLLRPEPPQTGERQVIVEGPGETAYVQLAYHAPAASHPDFFPFTILDSLLTGPSSLNLFGGGISNKTSRLYKHLVEKELAVSIGGGVQATIDPFLYVITATVHPDKEASEVISAVDQEIHRIGNELPEPAELSRAIKQARALFAYGSESISNQAFWMGFSEMFASYQWFENYLECLSAVTPQEVQRIAQQYLRPQNRVLGIYQPDGS